MDIKVAKVQRMLVRLINETIDPDWRFPRDPYCEQVLARGLERLKMLWPIDGISNDRIIDFIAYQVYRYRDLIGTRGNGWHLSWCFSENAVAKYKKQFMDSDGKSGMKYYINQWLSDNGLTRNKLASMISDQKHTLRKFVYMPSEDAIKRRFLNTERGHRLCRFGTTGWCGQSPVCRVCGFANDCMEETRVKYPELFRLRKECQR